ncbi:hypothetical protein PIB30_016117 [Stylosanthes scabra]|uniref:F-box domain-containing protein n=1 Tax=Stylosanthes scabra TaxID=79078 RepID=A0ABU6R7H6_9FABA|nr:hypothetical protein [Stylosanthes scabra]
MEEQIFPDDILLEIFARTEPKTTTRCRSLSKAWCTTLTTYTFRKENTFANTRKHNKLLIQVGLAPWISGPDALSMVDIQDGALIPCVLPFQVTPGGWWIVIGSEYGMVCMRYSEGGLSTSIKVWNPFLKKVRHLPDPTDRMTRQAMFGYAFGYTLNTDNYVILHVCKRHISYHYRKQGLNGKAGSTSSVWPSLEIPLA